MICAIYARVSKERCPTKGCGHLKTDHAKGQGKCRISDCECTRYTGQDPETQLSQLRTYARAQHWEIREFIDYETGKHSDRAQLQAMFEAASRREMGVVLVWALDRLSREGIFETLRHWRSLRDNGVQFESFSEPQFRTTGAYGDLFAELFIALAACFAKMERQRISDRTKAGLERARAQGRIGGRPARIFDRGRALELRDQVPPMSWREIGLALGGIPEASIRKEVRKLRTERLLGAHKTSRPKPKKRATNKS
jgi:DNA invertase Pin-like site-specific DNA recombinase